MKQQAAHILLVEDDPADAELTTRSLQHYEKNLRIVVARDGAEALDYLFCRGKFAARNGREHPSVVMLDLKLPRVSGHDVLKAIKEDGRTRCIPVIVMTSSNHEEDLRECYQRGANSFVQKPVEVASFRDAVTLLGNYWLRVNCAPPAAAFEVQ
ncbi:MAG TPA: response regulator [Candidatus Acidoferrum sp.]|nr:response regulator [Candidatus Acidoferrum sp.]